MNTRLLLNAALRHKIVLGIGAFLGIVLAFSSMYTFVRREPAGLRLAARSPSKYECTMQVLIEDPRFGIGRAGLEQDVPDAFERTVWLTPTYAQMIQGDVVRSAVASDHPMVGIDVKAEPLERSPIVQLTVTGGDRKLVKDIATAHFVALERYLRESQKAHDVPEQDSVSVVMLSGPTISPPGPSRNLERGVLAFLVPLSAALGLAYFLENLER